MTVRNIRSAAPSTKYSWARLAAMTAGLLLATVCFGGSAFAADDCSARTAHPGASTQCIEHHARAGVHGASKTQQAAKTKAAVATEGDALTPVSASSTAVTAPTTEQVRWPGTALPASTPVHRHGRAGGSPWRGRGASAGDRRPPSPDMLVATGAETGAPQRAGSSLGDLGHGGRLPSVPAPVAWAALLMGLLGLSAMARQPGVARAQSWAMSSLPSSAGRSAAGIGAVDRVDPARYAPSPARSPHQGHFVRAATASRFGVDA
jgi:hypothetical protein